MNFLKYLTGERSSGEDYGGKIAELSEKINDSEGPMIMVFDNAGLSSDVIRKITGSNKKNGYSHAALVVNDNGEYKICEAVNEFPFGMLKKRSGYIKTKPLGEALKYANKILLRKVNGTESNRVVSENLV